MKLSLLTTTLLLGALAPTSLTAQDHFRASLNGDQEVPPVTTDAVGWGTARITSTGAVEYHVETTGLSATAAHIHLGAVGSNGGVIVALSGGPTVFSGTSAPLGASDLAALRAGDTYFNVHTAANPGGEIRGQILAAPVDFSAVLQGSQEVPPNASTASGTATAMVNPDRSITYSVTTSGLSATAAHIHDAPIGTNGGVLFALSGGPTDWSGTTAPMTEAEFAMMQEKGFYINVHTVDFPGGEIRGQLLPTAESFGFGTPGNTVDPPMLSSAGAPMTGQNITLSVSGGTPSSAGVVVATLNPAATTLQGANLFLANPEVFRATLPTDASGNGMLTAGLPKLTANLQVYVQYFERVSGGLISSNALAIEIVSL